MKRVGLFLLAAVMVSALAGCSGGGDDPFDFNGTWDSTYLVVQSNAAAFRVGEVINGPIYITQTGTGAVVQIGGNNPMSGSCDPRAGTFIASAVNGRVSQMISGKAEDSDTISGELTVFFGSLVVRQTFTAQLTSRARYAASATRTAVRGVDGSVEGQIKTYLSMMR